MISVTYRTPVRSTISLPSDWKRQQEQHAVFTMICFLCAFISLSEDKLLHLEENKKETKKWFNALGRSTPFGGTKFGLTRSISNVSENVKPLLVSLKAYSEAEKKDHAKSAKEFFGETNNRNENGYITTDCTKLDFSDHHEGAPGEHRYVDHGDTRGEAAVQVELERYYGGAKALLAQNEAFLKGITEALLLTLHHTRRGEQARRVWTDFDPRPPRGGRQRPSTTAMRPLEFQSTPPARGGDHRSLPSTAPSQYFNPRPPRGGRRFVTSAAPKASLFQSTPPARGAPRVLHSHGPNPSLTKSPPPARGATTTQGDSHAGDQEFQSTPPRGGRHPDHQTGHQHQNISIHAPAWGATKSPLRRVICCLRFQSTPPARGATTVTAVPPASAVFQSTPPARGATTYSKADSIRAAISIHAPREGGDIRESDRLCRQTHISIHAPREGGDRSCSVST